MGSHHPVRILLGVFSVLILLLTGVGAISQTLLKAKITTLDVTSVLDAPSTAPVKPVESPQAVTAPTGAVPLPSPSQSPSAPPLPEPLAVGDPVNYLLIGSDTREDQGAGYGNANLITGQRSDSTMLIHLNASRTAVSVLSIPRDLWINLPSCKTGSEWSSEHQGRFNEAFSIGGAECTIRAVKTVTGLPVNHVIVVDFSGFKDMVNAIGGLKVCISQPISDDKSNLHLPAGKQTLNGKQALGLARARYSLGDGSDISRINRQQAMAKLFLDQLKSTGALNNPTTLYRLADASLNSTSVDPDLASLPALTSLMTTIGQIAPTSIGYAVWPWVSRPDGATVMTDTTRTKPILDAFTYDEPLPSTSRTPDPKPSGKKGLCKNPIA